MSENKVGRPTVMTEDVLQKLEYAFMRGLSDVEACVYADICPATLYNYCNDNPDFLERKAVLKEHTKAQAKLNVAEAIEKKDVDVSKWYLERKAKDEFSTKQEVAANITYEDRLKDVVDADEY